MAALTDQELEAIVATQIGLAKSHDRNERESSRSKALDYFLGNVDQYIPPEVNRSRVVSRDVADTIGWLLPGIIRVFTASDRMAVAEPVGVEDQQFAKEATEGLNYTFWKANKGYEIVYNATWDALLVGNGIIKTYYDDYPTYATSFHTGLSDDELTLLLSPGEEGDAPEVIAKTEHPVTMLDPATNQPVQSVVYDVKIKRKKAPGKFCIEVIAPEQFLIDADAICTDEAAFTAHWERKPRSELVAMGYDKAVIYEIPEAAKNQTPEESSRSPTLYQQQSTDKSMDLVDYFECFIRIDVDDDGEAELVRACFAGDDGGKLLDWEVWEDEHPFDDIPCEPVPHRWDARSITDETMDVMNIKTVLLRQGINNTYWSNNPLLHLRGKFKNPEMVVTPQFGGVLIGDENSQVVPIAMPNIAKDAFAALEYQDEVIQKRTGVGRQTMALDPEALQNQTATASQNQRDAGYSQVEMLARNMAEWGWKKVFRKLMRLMIKHQGPMSFVNNGKPVQIDPRFWNADMDVTIDVGLGTGSRDKDAVTLHALMGVQQALGQQLMQIPGGQQKALEFLPRVLNTAKKLAESSGLKNPDMYFPDITAEDMQGMLKGMADAASKPDPEVMKEQMKAQLGAQLEQVKAQAQQFKEQVQAQADMQTEQFKQQMEAAKQAFSTQLEETRKNGELQFKYDQLAQQRELELLKLGMSQDAGGNVTNPQQDAISSLSEMMQEAVSIVQSQLQALHETANAPRSIERDAKTGRATGVRVGDQVRQVTRDPQTGQAVGLQ